MTASFYNEEADQPCGIEACAACPYAATEHAERPCILQHGWALLGDAVDLGQLFEPEAAERLRQIVPGYLDSRPWGYVMRHYYASEVALLLGLILDEVAGRTNGNQRVLPEHEEAVLAFVPRLVTSWREGDREVHTLANIVHPLAALRDFLQDAADRERDVALY